MDTSAQLFDCRDAFSETLLALAAVNPDVVAVCNDSVGSSKLGRFQDQYPERLVNVGIAEQNMVGVGAGLANGGKVPFVCAASCFLTGRALEQIKADVAYSETNVKLCGISSGMAYGELGPTHHSIEDFAWIRVLQGSSSLRRPTRSRRGAPWNGQPIMMVLFFCDCRGSACQTSFHWIMYLNRAKQTFYEMGRI